MKTPNPLHIVQLYHSGRYSNLLHAIIPYLHDICTVANMSISLRLVFHLSHFMGTCNKDDLIAITNHFKQINMNAYIETTECIPVEGNNEFEIMWNSLQHLNLTLSCPG